MNSVIVRGAVAVVILGLIVGIIVLLIKRTKKFEASHHKVIKDIGGACSAEDADAIVCPADFPRNMGIFTTRYPSQTMVAIDGGAFSCGSDVLSTIGKNKSYLRHRKHCGTAEATQAHVDAGGWAANN